MKHPEEIDIARFVDGNITKAEREAFLDHFAQCESCLKAYTDTLKFAAQRKKRFWFQSFPIITNVSVYPSLQSAGFFFKRKLAVPAPAFVILLLVLLFPLIWKNTHNESNNAKLKYIEEYIMKKEDQANYGLFPSKNLITSAIRAGFFIEDLKVLFDSGGKKELETKISGMLEAELKKIAANQDELAFLGQEEMSKTNFKNVIVRLQDFLEAKSLSQLYQFGRFLEQSILATFEKKTPKKNELEKYLQIVRKYNLPKVVFDKIEEIKNTGATTEGRELWNDVKEIF